MLIEAGKYYKTRDGRKVGPMAANWCDDRCWPFLSRPDFPLMYWRKDGTCCEGSITKMRPNLDLISPWSQAPTSPVREVTKTITTREIIEGNYGRLRVGTSYGKYANVSLTALPSEGHHMTATELRAAAAVLLELAGALDN